MAKNPGVTHVLLDVIGSFVHDRIREARSTGRAAMDDPVTATVTAALVACNTALDQARRELDAGGDASEPVRLLLAMADCWEHRPYFPFDIVVAYQGA